MARAQFRKRYLQRRACIRYTGHSLSGFDKLWGHHDAVKLTQRQELLITRYLRDAGNALGDVSDTAREQAMARLTARIYRKLEEISSRGSRTHDEDVVAVLSELGAPARQAKECIDGLGTYGALVLAPDDRKWLGVCGGLAQYLGADARWVRAAFLLLGITGPVIVIIYLGLYIEMYVHSDPDGIPRVDMARLVIRPLAVVGAVIALHVGARLLLWGVLEAYNRFAGLGPLANLGKWDWLRANASFFLFCALFNLAPLSILAALPLPNGWSETLKRTAQAGLAIYAFVLSFGVAAFLAGVILRVVKELGA